MTDVIDKQAEAKELREAILDEVVSLYYEAYASAENGQDGLSPRANQIKDRIFELVTMGLGIKE